MLYQKFINAFQQAEVTLANASRGVTPQDLGVRPALGLLETVQEAIISTRESRTIRRTVTTRRTTSNFLSIAIFLQF